MSQMQKIAPFAGSVAIYMLTNSCAKSRWIFSRTEELLIVCCCSSQDHGGKPLVFCRARLEETTSNQAFGRVAQHLLWPGGCPEARRCSARCQLNNSQQSTATRSSTPQIFCELFTELHRVQRFPAQPAEHPQPVKVSQHLTRIWISWKYKSFYTTMLDDIYLIWQRKGIFP